MKTIFLIMISAIGLGSCTSCKVLSVKSIDWPSVNSLTFDKVETMANQYKVSITRNSRLNIREINLSAIRLAEVLKGTVELKLIMGAMPVGDPVIILERRDNITLRKKWYLLTDLFKPSQSGSLDRPPLCSRTPASCVPTFPAESLNLGLTAARAKVMAEDYFRQSDADYDKMILQMNLLPSALIPLMEGKSNVKLISAIDRNQGDSHTLILEFVNGSQVGYLNLKTLVPQPVCPPPRPCTLSEF